MSCGCFVCMYLCELGTQKRVWDPGIEVTVGSLFVGARDQM